MKIPQTETLSAKTELTSSTEGTVTSSKKPCCKKVIWAGVVVVVLAAVAGTALFLLQPREKATRVFPPSISSPAPSINPTVNWITYQVLDSNGQFLRVEYKLPSTLIQIEWKQQPGRPFSSGKYQKYRFPNGTDFIVFPVGKIGVLQATFEKFTNLISSYNLKQRTITLFGRPAIDFQGYIINEKMNKDILILGDGEKEFRGIISKIDDRNFLYILHYQDKFTPPQGCSYDFIVCIKGPCPPILRCPTPELYKFEKDYTSDEKLFDQILSTFRFEGE